MPIMIQYQANTFSENFDINFIKYFIHKYPTIPEIMVPIIIEVQLYVAASAISIFKSGYTIEAPNIIGILSKNEYLAAISLFNPENNPVAIVQPERENPGNTAIP